jgi:phosphatidate cytidylyltransferase
MVAEQKPRGLTSLLPRLITAIAYAAIMLSAIIWGRELGLAIVISIASMLAVSEFYTMTRREHRLPNEVFGILATGLMPIATALWGQIGLLAVVTGLMVAALIWHVAFGRVTTADTAVTVFGAVYVGFMLSHFVLIRGLESGTELALATLVAVWANDVFAYLVGSTLGRHKMSPSISPNKSWEGFAAGAVFTTLVWVAVYFVTDTQISLAWFALVGISVSLAGVFGDLFESRLKREAGVKDSGKLLPGHGGFLDRFDSLIMVSVVAYYLLILGGAQ